MPRRKVLGTPLERVFFDQVGCFVHWHPLGKSKVKPLPFLAQDTVTVFTF